MSLEFLYEDVCWTISAVFVVLTFPISIPICILKDKLSDANFPFYIPSWKKRGIERFYEENQRRIDESKYKNDDYLFSTSSYSMTI